MNAVVLMAAVMLPIVAGVPVSLLPFSNRKQMMWYVMAVVLVNTGLVMALILNPPAESFTLFRFSENLSVTFRLDGLGKVFAGMVAFLWPLSTLYAFEYMKMERHEKYFFMFYTITYGVTVGVALSGNILTLYFFFEILSLVTLPLVMHTLSREAIEASRTYFYYMMGGAAFGLIGMVFLIVFGTTIDFVPGGVLDMAVIGDRRNVILLVYVLCFFGFSVKAAIWPFSSWLPKAGVAPTPVTALLHAVAVVKTGAFAVMRVTYYSFGTDLLRGTWAQYVVMGAVIVTIVYGCSRALKETHLKRRLAWSTVSNLSYVLFGVTIMTPLGLLGALTHMLAHAIMKICAFFCAGALIYKAGVHYVYEMDGMAYRMPKVCIAYTISGLALMGVPGLCGFIGKWNLAGAAVESGNPLAAAGVAALLVSAILTAIYMLTVSVRAFFPGRDFDFSSLPEVRDPGWMMILPLGILVILMFVFGLHPEPLLEALRSVVSVFR